MSRTAIGECYARGDPVQEPRFEDEHGGCQNDDGRFKQTRKTYDSTTTHGTLLEL